MTARRWLLPLVCLLAAVGCGDAETLGPRVTIEGELTLAEAARAFGRQVGCTVQVPHLDRNRAEQRVSLAVRGASPTGARESLERAFGMTLRRWWRGGYGIEMQPAPATPALGQPLDGLPGWTCWLTGVRASLSASLRSLLPDGLRVELNLVPRIVIQTPSDAEALRIVGCTPPRLEPVLDAMPDARGRMPLIRWNQNGQDPSSWLLEQSLPLPSPDARQLDSLYFDLHLIDLRAHRFVFDDLDQTTPQLQSDAELDVTIKPSGQPGVLALTLSGPLPAAGREVWQAAMSREGMIDTRLVADDGAVLPTGLNTANRDTKDGVWTLTATLRRPERGDQPRPGSLEVTVHLPVGQPESRTIAFRGVPLPPLP